METVTGMLVSRYFVIMEVTGQVNSRKNAGMQLYRTVLPYRCTGKLTEIAGMQLYS